MEENVVVEMIFQAIEKHGLMKTIEQIFGAGAKVQLPFSESACNTEIEQLNLSVRSYNCLKRAGLNTVDKVINVIQENKLCSIRNLGNKSIAEIRVKIFEFGYNSLTERERKNFAKTLFELNKDRFKIAS